MGKMSVKRPEHTGPAEDFYSPKEANKYSANSHMITIQTEMTERCLELMALPDDDKTRFMLDIGCGSGISGEVLTEHGHEWVGMDISPSMLDVANDREVDGDLILSDIGQGVPFRAGTFDGAISVSALQWLCNADTSEHHPVKRLYRFFSTLYAALNRGTRAVFQFYPENDRQVQLITKQSMRAGFTGGLVVDFPNSTKAKKVFLVLFTGGQLQQLPQPLGVDDKQSISNVDRTRYAHKAKRGKKGKPEKKSKEWIQAKKDKARAKGLDTANDSKYTGRKRNRF